MWEEDFPALLIVIKLKQIVRVGSSPTGLASLHKGDDFGLRDTDGWKMT